ncbi:non-ribosomal peptide synthetase, partial [Niastella populi]|uniref:non-ribosomal peptide synthetase n=1 Tax=Niastella populi TaxID=550983 RepID=UPI001055475D
FVQQELTTPFDLSSGPLLRAGLLQVQDNRWILLFSMHHIITDGWSMEILMQELVQLYYWHRKSQTGTLLPLRIQYKDYVIWQQQQLSGHALQQHRDFWMQILKGPLPVLNFPGDYVRPALKTFDGGTVLAKVDANISRQFKMLVQHQGATLFMGLLATINAILHRYTGQEDIITGSPVAGREHIELENQLGLYANTLVFRTRFAGGDSFIALLQNIKQLTLQAYQHQGYPFDTLVNELRLPPDTSRNALFDVMLVLQNNQPANSIMQAGELSVSAYRETESPVSKFDLTFGFVESGDGLQVGIEYNSNIFRRETVVRLSNHLQQLLAAITHQPDAPINTLDYLNADEKQRLLYTFNATTTAYQDDKTVVHLIHEQAKRHPDKIAIKGDHSSYSYRQLMNRACQVTRRINGLYDTSDKAPVGVLLSRSADMIAVLLGVLQSGRPYIPLDPIYPAQRLKYILKHSGCQILITEENRSDHFEIAGLSILKIEDIPVQNENDLITVNDISSAHDTAYIIYTSGSTGKPKGIAIAHRSVVNFLNSMRSKPGITANDLLFAVTTCSFDIAVLEMFLPLISGACVYMAGYDTLSDPQRIIKKLEETGPTIIQATPSFYQMLFDSGWEGNGALKVLCGGDLLSEAVAEKLLQHCRELWNMYGPTETTIWSTTGKIEQPKQARNIGAPISNTQIFIVDEQLQLAPIGVPGTIFIGGDGLAAGYYRNEMLTEERFIKNPFNPKTRIYNTGDLGKWNADGSIEFLGRKDDQVK